MAEVVGPRTRSEMAEVADEDTMSTKETEESTDSGSKSNDASQEPMEVLAAFPCNCCGRNFSHASTLQAHRKYCSLGYLTQQWSGASVRHRTVSLHSTNTSASQRCATTAGLENESIPTANSSNIPFKNILTSKFFDKKRSKFVCDRCDEEYACASFLKRHRIEEHGTDENGDEDSEFFALYRPLLKCALCEFYLGRKDFIPHYERIHSIELSREVLQFDTASSFTEWKVRMENESKCRYIKGGGHKTPFKRNVYRQYFSCHRSGSYFSRNKGERRLKSKGSIKIDAYCPASIKATYESSGKINVVYIKTHVGHENDVARLLLTPSEKQFIGAKLAEGVAFSEILAEAQQYPANSGFDRLRLLTRKDLYNIERRFNLCSNTSRFKEDKELMEYWIDTMQNSQTGGCVLLYKPQGTDNPEFPQLTQDDFVLILMNHPQAEIFKSWNTSCVCIDGTYDTSNYMYKLVTLMVVDVNTQDGFPCAFLISTRIDSAVLSLFFMTIRNKIGRVGSCVFMSDIPDYFFLSWIEIMELPQKRFFCSWCVYYDWQKKLKSLIKTKKRQQEVHTLLKELMEEKDTTVFDRRTREVFKMLSESDDTAEFGKYLLTNFVNCSALWGFSYRYECGWVKDDHIEKLHKKVRNIYLNGTKANSLYKKITFVMKFVIDTFLSSPLAVNLPNLSVLKEVQKKHKASFSMQMSSVVENDDDWLVYSKPTTKATESYDVKKVWEDCNCGVICYECNACVHQYSCSCPDSCNKENMCKHIHLVCRFLSLASAKNFIPQVNTSEQVAENSVILYDDEYSVVEEEVIATEMIETSDVSMEKIMTNEVPSSIAEISDTTSTPPTVKFEQPSHAVSLAPPQVPGSTFATILPPQISGSTVFTILPPQATGSTILKTSQVPAIPAVSSTSVTYTNVAIPSAIQSSENNKITPIFFERRANLKRKFEEAIDKVAVPSGLVVFENFYATLNVTNATNSTPKLPTLLPAPQQLAFTVSNGQNPCGPATIFHIPMQQQFTPILPAVSTIQTQNLLPTIILPTIQNLSAQTMIQPRVTVPNVPVTIPSLNVLATMQPSPTVANVPATVKSLNVQTTMQPSPIVANVPASVKSLNLQTTIQPRPTVANVPATAESLNVQTTIQPSPTVANVPATVKSLNVQTTTTSTLANVSASVTNLNVHTSTKPRLTVSEYLSSAKSVNERKSIKPTSSSQNPVPKAVVTGANAKAPPRIIVVNRTILPPSKSSNLLPTTIISPASSTNNMQAIVHNQKLIFVSSVKSANPITSTSNTKK